MNNATINYLYQTADSVTGKEHVHDPHIAYVIEDSAYVFPHVGFFSYIIDFSRAILGDYERIVFEYGPAYADAYFRDQRMRAMQTIYHYFPALMEKHHDVIEAMMLKNFPLMFKVMTVIDTYVIMSNIAAMFTIDDAFTKGQIKLPKEISRLLDVLVQSAEKLFTAHILGIVDGTINSVDDIDWPNLTVMRDNFSEYLMETGPKAPDYGIIIDIFNSNNEIIDDISEYDTWGPLLSIDTEIALRKKHGQELYKEVLDWLKYKNSDETEAVEAITDKYAAQERDVLQYEDWMIL